jgi:hypothetical protein
MTGRSLALGMSFVTVLMTIAAFAMSTIGGLETLARCHTS